ncbi:MAG: PAS domain S-box protein [Nitrospirales bacterium]
MPEPTLHETSFDVLDHLPQGVFILRQDWIVDFWNHSLEEWTAIPKTTILGRPIGDFYPTLITPVYSSRLEALFQGGPPAIFSYQFHPHFLPCLGTNGLPRIQQTVAKALWNQREGTWQALIMIQDVTNLHRQVQESERLRNRTGQEIARHQKTEAALQESEIRLTLAVNGINEGIWDWMDVSQDEEWWSPHFYELLGYTPGEIPANLKTFKRLLHPDDYSNTFQALHDHFHTYAPFDIHCRLQTKPGDFRWFRNRGTVLRDSQSRPTRMAGSIQDITERKKTDEQFRLVVEAAPSGMIMIDQQGTIVLVNQLVTQLFGYPREEMLGHPVEMLIPGGFQPQHPAHRTQLLTQPQPRTIGNEEDLYGLRKDRSEFPVELGLNPLVIVDETFMLASVVDITERKNAQATVAAQNRLLALDAEVGRIINQTQDLPILLQQCTQAIVDHLQAAFARIWTLNSSQSLLELQASAGLYTHLNGPHGRIPVGQFKIGQIASQKKPHLTNKVIGDPRIPEQEWAKQEGLLAFAGYPLLKDQDVVGVLALFAKHPLTDMTLETLKMVGDRITTAIERQQIRQAHHALFQRNERILASVGEGIFGLDLNGYTTFVNPAGASMLGYEPHELIGLLMHTTIHHTKPDGSPYPRETCPMYAAFKDGVVHHKEDEVLWRKDGTSFPISYSSTPIRDDQNHLVGAVVIFTDNTEQIRANEKIRQTTQNLETINKDLQAARDEALAAARAKSDFLATMSHEIRTPLNAVIGLTGLLLNTSLNDDQQDMVNTVQQSGEFLLGIINDILDFSKIEAGKLDLEMVDFDIRATLDDIIGLLSEQAMAKDLELSALIEASTPLEIHGDPGRIRQILVNLISNAIKFTNSGVISVYVSAKHNGDQGLILHFSVSDTGIGLSAEAQLNLFQSFSQADSSTTRKYGGSGLGLAISKRLVTLMHGEIGVESQAGQGSRFWFTLPAACSPRPHRFPEPCNSLQGRRLCIIDGHQPIQRLLQYYAETWGMVCQVANDASAGLDLIHNAHSQNQPFDAVIVNYAISESQGSDKMTLGLAIQQDSHLRNVPFILLAELGKRGEARLTQDSGFVAYLAQPVRYQQLYDCLRMVLDKTEESSGPLLTPHTPKELRSKTQHRILLVEDNLVNQKVVVRMLQTMGFRSDIATTGREALEVFRQTAYDLILMDCQMPDMDGFEATRQIRAWETDVPQNRELKEEESVSLNSSLLTPQRSRIPIVALTANALQGDRDRCLEAGMDDFLAKPVRMKDLKVKLQIWLTSQTAPLDAQDPKQPHGPNPFSSETPTELVQDPIDQAVWDELRELGGEDEPDFLCTLIDQFLDDLPRHLHNIEQALQQQDSPALTKAAHTCKGSSRYLGAFPLSELCRQLETFGREHKFSGIDRYLSDLHTEISRVRHSLQGLRPHITS